jgi:phage shock protein E
METVDTKELFQRHTELNPEEVVLDVRGPEEYSDGHIPGSINIPHTEVAGRVEELKKYKRIYIHCMKGGRAQKAFNALNEAGLTNLVCIADGGMKAWQEAGYPLEK